MNSLIDFVGETVVEGYLGVNIPVEGLYRELWTFGFTWAFLTVGFFFFYVFFSGLDYWYVFVYKHDEFFPNGDKVPPGQHWADFKTSVEGMWAEALIFTVFQHSYRHGWGFMYYDVSDFGWPYMLLSTAMFIIFSDFAIYFIHRGLHHPRIYKYIHKLHHRPKWVSPWSSHAFHPLDGSAQGLPYALCVYLFPIHHIQHFVLLMFVNFWTISIHDRVYLVEGWGINGAAHHTLHHTRFNYNYGQYFTFWDKVMGTHMIIDDVEKSKVTANRGDSKKEVSADKATN